jgi:hypothetical protein
VQRASAIIFMLAPLGALVLSGALTVPTYLLAEFPRVFVRHVLLLFVLAGVCSLLLASLGWRLRKILGPVRRSAYAGSRADRAADALSSLDRARGVRLWCAWETFFAAVTCSGFRAVSSRRPSSRCAWPVRSASGDATPRRWSLGCALLLRRSLRVPARSAEPIRWRRHA